MLWRPPVHHRHVSQYVHHAPDATARQVLGQLWGDGARPTGGGGHMVTGLDGHWTPPVLRFATHCWTWSLVIVQLW